MPSSPPSEATGIRRSCSCGATRGRSIVPFLAYDLETRKMICTTNTIDSINARVLECYTFCGQ